MAAATTSVNGYLTSTDWTTFNGKQAALVSGTNIKTVGGVSLLGSGDVGTIGVAYGGTGLTSLTAGYIPYGNGTSAFGSSSALSFNSGTGTLSATAFSGNGASLTNVIQKSAVFSAYQSSSQTLPNVTWTAIQFQTKNFDSNTAYNTSTGVFSAPVTGYYQINSTVAFTTEPVVMAIEIYVQGSPVNQGSYFQGAASYAVSVSSLIYLQSGWSCQIYAIVTGTPSTTANAVSTWFNGALVSV